MHDYFLPLKSTALAYARLGLALFPVVPKGKNPLTTHGCKDATTDPDQIEKWWTEFPDANIAIATGSKSGGLVVIDMDVDEDTGVIGYYSLQEWQKNMVRSRRAGFVIPAGAAITYICTATPRSKIVLAFWKVWTSVVTAVM